MSDIIQEMYACILLLCKVKISNTNEGWHSQKSQTIVVRNIVVNTACLEWRFSDQMN